jgi:ribonuclease III
VSPLLRRSASPLEKRLGHRFSAPELLDMALMHRSYANERELGENYERLEFLGDAVLGLVTAEYLYQSRPALPEGELSKLKSQLVSTATLARFAEQLELGAELKLGVGEERSGGRGKASLLADSIEAVFGAVYLDGGVKAARGVIHPMLEAALASPVRLAEADAKTRLQELAQAQGWALPEYRLAAEAGPDHAKLFTVECWLRGEPVGSGEERSKKLAEQKAAAAALAHLASLDLPVGRP